MTVAALARTRAVLVDLDGTLADTLPEIAAAIDATLADAGRPPVDRSVVAEAVGEGSSMLVDRVLGPGAAARWLPVYLAHYRARNGSGATLYPGAREGLDAFRAMGLAVACVTNKPRELVGPLFATLGIDALFDTIVGGGDTVEQKPKPAPVLAACERLGVAPHEAVLVGDSINDARAARAAGATSLTVPYGYPGSAGERGRAGALLAEGLTDAVVADLLDAARWIAERGVASRDAAPSPLDSVA